MIFVIRLNSWLFEFCGQNTLLKIIKKNKLYICFFSILMSKPQTLAVKLTPSAEKIVKKGHPWVFSNSIAKLNKSGEAGDLAILFGHKTDKVYAIGLYDPDSIIQIKVIHRGKPIPINASFFHQKINNAFSIRKPLLKEKTNAYRLIFGENDGLPGLVVDIYNRSGVLKLYSEIWLPYLKHITPSLLEVAKIQTLILRLSRNLQKKELGLEEGEVLFGNAADSRVIFEEHGIKFKTDLILGHKTGFFLDHRANRHKVYHLAKNKSVLDVFSYSGGFSVHALAGGAREVTSVDFSAQALELAKENAKLNPHDGTHHTLAGDAFEILKELIQQNKTFQLVILDPPSFASNKRQQSIALKKYGELARLGARLTEKKGLLLLASCSASISKEDFLAIHQKEFSSMGLHYEIMEITEHDIDHPVGFKEGAYLKSVYYRIY